MEIYLFFRTLSTLYPECSIMLKNIQTNRRNWKYILNHLTKDHIKCNGVEIFNYDLIQYCANLPLIEEV